MVRIPAVLVRRGGLPHWPVEDVGNPRRALVETVLPSAGELFFGAVAFFAVLVAAAVGTGWDLRSRGIAAWWLVAALSFFMLPIGLMGWAVLRWENRSARA